MSERRLRDTHKNCLCLVCSKWFNHLGIARHRAMHRDLQELCEIRFSDGRVVRYKFHEVGSDEQ